MSQLAQDSSTTMHETFVLQNASDVVNSITRAMRSIARLYATALADARLDAEMLIGLLYLGGGAPRHEIESTFGFAICAPGEVLDRLLVAGFVSAEANDLLRPTAETQAIFRWLSQLAQQENLRWREQLQNVPGGILVLDDFLTMLRTSHHA